ncbi:histidine phosphatase superfamily (branch 2) domain-containing protein [Ditylenchus destructor]|uniref:Histidine phosphatase superfamily (Branch 2) domain-containing protein n=1 Tax=Ditylenchus destructor TaxID=166010 RepID=A0AAD4R5N6_9BILA|nr:histidine phosphatase superfamily (branch 2) domain-containing protein [Ditylenchus destructor]
MVSWLGVALKVLLLNNLWILINATFVEETDELLFVQVIWRHGDRAPVSTYPTDPHGEDTWPYGWGELTQLGMEQQLALGRLLRSRYILGDPPLVSSRYNPKEVYIRSTDVNRTLVSAMANLAGMFSAGQPGVDFPTENATHGKWPSRWTPIPVHTVPERTDHIGNILADCPRAEQLHKIAQNTKEFREIQRENRLFFDYVSQQTGKNFSLVNINELNDVTYIEMLYNLTQPSWVTESVVNQIQNLTQKANEFFYGIAKPYVPELVRIRGGNLLKAIVDTMNQKIRCRRRFNRFLEECQWIRQLKYYAYSAHDTTLGALLSTFGDEQGVVPGGLPHYTASIAIELWNTTDFGPAVKIFYHSAFNQDYRLITDLTKGCPAGQQYCPLDIFERRSRRFMPVNIEKEMQQQEYRSNRTNKKGQLEGDSAADSTEF